MTIYRVIVSHGAFDGFYDFNNPDQAMKFADAVITAGRGNYTSLSSDKAKPKARIEFKTDEEIATEVEYFAQKHKEFEEAAKKEAEDVGTDDDE